MKGNFFMNFIEVEDYPDIFGNQGFFGITEGFFFFRNGH